MVPVRLLVLVLSTISLLLSIEQPHAECQPSQRPIDDQGSQQLNAADGIPNQETLIGANPDYAKCWLLDGIQAESLNQIETRLVQCEHYYDNFIWRRFSTWGYVAEAIQVWVNLIDEDLSEQLDARARLREIVNQDIGQITSLNQRLAGSFQSISSPDEANQDQTLFQVKHLLKDAFDWGEGICVHLMEPQMMRFLKLIRGLGVILRAQGLSSLGFETLINRSIISKSYSRILMLFLVQKICFDLRRNAITWDDDRAVFVFNNQIGRYHLDTMIGSWKIRIDQGRCTLTDLYLTRVAFNYQETVGAIFSNNLWTDLDSYAQMMLENCNKYLSISPMSALFDLSILDQNTSVDRRSVFQFYRASWDLWHHLKQQYIAHSDSLVGLLELRSQPGNELLESFFLAPSRDESYRAAYLRGEGLCLAYDKLNLYAPGLYETEVVQILDRFANIRGFRPLLANRLMSFYVMWKICEQALILPLHDTR